MIAENGEDSVARAQPAQASTQHRLPSAPAHEVAGDGHQVELTALGPRERAAQRAPIQRDGPEVKVREMEDAKTVELRGQAFDRNIALEELDPLGLEERPGETRRAHNRGSDDRSEHLALLAGPGEIRAQPLASLLELAAEPLGPGTAAVARGIAGAATTPREDHDRSGGAAEGEEEKVPWHVTIVRAHRKFPCRPASLRTEGH